METDDDDGGGEMGDDVLCYRCNSCCLVSNVLKNDVTLVVIYSVSIQGIETHK